MRTCSVPITPAITPADLWARAEAQTCSELETRSFLPRLRVASDVLHDLKRRARMRSSLFLAGFHQQSRLFHVEDLLESASSDAELLIELRPNRPSNSHELMQRVEDAAASRKRRYAVWTDCFSFLASYSLEKEGVRLNVQLTYPDCNFELRRIYKRPKVVSCPLVQELCSSDDFRIGFLTMDQSLRLVPVLEAKSYPLVGVWVAGGPQDQDDYKAFVWTVCVRFVTDPQVRTRIGNGPQQFLLVKFPKVQCAEVTLVLGAQWQTAEIQSLVTAPSDLTIDFAPAQCFLSLAADPLSGRLDTLTRSQSTRSATPSDISVSQDDFPYCDTSENTLEY